MEFVIAPLCSTKNIYKGKPPLRSGSKAALVYTAPSLRLRLRSSAFFVTPRCALPHVRSTFSPKTPIWILLRNNCLIGEKPLSLLCSPADRNPRLVQSSAALCFGLICPTADRPPGDGKKRLLRKLYFFLGLLNSQAVSKEILNKI